MGEPPELADSQAIIVCMASDFITTNTRIIRTDALHDIANRLGAVIVTQQRQALDAGDEALGEALLDALVEVDQRVLTTDVLNDDEYKRACDGLTAEANLRRAQLTKD